jgi:hypoxia up-regulated 1
LSVRPAYAQASLLAHAKALAEVAADGAPVVDAVLTVPAFFPPAARAALLDAARLAGLNPQALLHTHAAAALQYGIERDFAGRSETVLFYDLGAGCVEAALVRFSAYADAQVRVLAWLRLGG